MDFYLLYVAVCLFISARFKKPILDIALLVLSFYIMDGMTETICYFIFLVHAIIGFGMITTGGDLSKGKIDIENGKLDLADLWLISDFFRDRFF